MTGLARCYKKERFFTFIFEIFVPYPNSTTLEADYATVIADRPIMCAEYRLPLLAKTDPPCIAVSLR